MAEIFFKTETELPKETKSLSQKALFFIFSILIFIYLFVHFIFTAPAKFPEGIILNIEQGESLHSLSGQLKTDKIIRSRALFESFIILLGGEKNIFPGDYFLPNRMSVFEVAKKISTRDRGLAPLKITIPEGYDLNDMADIFSNRLHNFNKESFLQLTSGKEGYLFPDTYFFFSADNEEIVINSLENNFQKKIATVESDILASGKTEKQIIIMASLIEREANGDNDREIISGILWNRLKKNMPLQVDAELWTYKNKGLPNQPICNPGIKAIKAAIFPQASSYLYYLHDKQGVIYYAKTFEEHKKNIKKYLK